MKIALIHHQLTHGGGMETYLIDLIEELHAQGHEIEIITAKASRDFALPSGVTIKVLNSFWPFRLLRKLRFFYQVKSYLHKQVYDLSISTTRAYAKDLVITGGTHKGYMHAHRRFRLRDFVEAWLEKKTYQSAGKIIAHSPQIKNELMGFYGIPSSKIFMLYPPVHAEKFKFKPHQFHRPVRLLFVSTSHKRKGGFLLLDALKGLPADAFTLTIAGRPFKQARHLKQKVMELGYVQDIAALYQENDLLVLPSYFEPFGLVAAQALECGMPVLISSRCGVAELVAPEEGLILHEQSTPALQRLLLQALHTSFNIQPHFIERSNLNRTEHVKMLLS